jgi:hypothetical protein
MGSRLSFWGVAIVAVLLGWAMPVGATPVTYQFSVTAINGPLQGETSAGTFTFDSSIIPDPASIPFGGGSLNMTGLFTALSFTWEGVHYDETNTDTSNLSFDEFGRLYAALFGTDCGPSGFGCGVGAHPERPYEWSFGIFEGVGLFVYKSPTDTSDNFLGSVSMSGPVAAPVPGTLPLLFAATFALWLVRSRRGAVALPDPERSLA